MSESPPETGHDPNPRWCPLSAIERRVLGVLIEKAKTVPESYPMTVNGLMVGANQKSNRFPMMNIESDAVERALAHLRQLGAVAEVWGSGRVAKYRHYGGDWFGVESTEVAVLAELLLRGAQTEGELRTRASRMAPIADLGAMRSIIQTLKDKKLVLSITPEGRGHVVCHNLYEPRELEKVKREFEAVGAAALASADEADDADEPAAAVEDGGRTKPWQIEIDALKAEVAGLRDELRRLRESLGEA
ncbi:MAG: DUF480 domain-containing protein [Planctomycetaceae bacterium]|nr:DUF480 domain-containing protein [Planctomycetaceae bacterium]